MAISAPRVALTVRPHDPTPLWFLLRACVIATIALSAATAAANVYDALAAPDEFSSNLSARIWYFWYAYSDYATWPAFVLTLILLMWLTYRLARNLHALAPNKFTMSPTYAVGYYIVPIANIIMPPRVTGLIARDTFAAAATQNHHNRLIGWWWGTFLLTALVGNVATILATNSGAYDASRSFDGAAYESSLWLSATAWIVNIVSCFFMLRVFGPLTHVQAKLVRDWTARQAA